MFDVVIPTKNRPEDIGRLLDSIYIQTILPSKIIIVDQSNKKMDIDYTTAPEAIEIVHLYNPQISGLCAAKNFGVTNCTDDFIFFFDDDIILDSDFFEIILHHFEESPNYYGICGRQKNSKSSKLKTTEFSLFHKGKFKDIRKKCNSGFVKDRIVKTNVLPGGITAYKREVFSSYCFDEVLIKYCLGEDMDFSYRVSQQYDLGFATDALALHNHSAVGRYDPVESFACKVAGYAYFYQKNMSSSIDDRFCFLLVNLGIWADAFSYTIKKHNMDAFRGISRGKKYMHDGFQGVPFIDYKKFLEEQL